MSKPKIPNQRKANIEHKKRVEYYAAMIQHAYDTMASEIALSTSLANPSTDTIFSFSDYQLTKEAVRKLQLKLMSEVRGIIMSGTSQEWKESNLIQDLVAKKVLTAYTGTNRHGETYSRYFQTNPDVLKAFQERKDEGMDLSSRVWELSDQYKNELEEAITAALSPGISATELATELKKYLKEPDKRFRRIKEKLDDGTIKWHLSKNAKSYHPGQGVYRSSSRNAQRLARTEINMAYRTAEQERWKQFDFVVGYEVKTTQNGHHIEDICDQLAGKYPKDFKFVGWHPQCMCYCIPILKTEDEFWSLEGTKSVNEITELPPNFREWIDDNRERIETAEERGKLPYFIRDNKDKVDNILNTKNRRKNPLEIAAERHAARTKEDVYKIRENWSYRKINMIWDAIAKGDLPYESLGKLKELEDYIALGNFDEFNIKAKEIVNIKNNGIKNKTHKDKKNTRSVKTEQKKISKDTEQEKINKIRNEIDKKKIKDISDVQRIFREFYDQFPEEFNHVFVDITTFDRAPIPGKGFTLGYSIHDKEIAFNTNGGFTGESPFNTLVKALNKIRDGKKLTLDQHRSINTVVHELLHQKAGRYVDLNPHNAGDYKRTAMETMNEYASRNLHKQFLERLGATNLEGHEKILRKGNGYNKWVSRIIDFVDNAKLKHDEIGKQFAKTLVTKSYDTMDKELYNFFKSHVKTKNFSQSMDEVLKILEDKSSDGDTKWKSLMKKWFA